MTSSVNEIFVNVNNANYAQILVNSCDFADLVISSEHVSFRCYIRDVFCQVGLITVPK